MAKYNKIQTIYSLSVLANIGSNLKGTASEIQTELTTELKEILANDEVKQLIGEWQVVWGPVAYQVPRSNVADHVMYVAYNQNLSQYVVAIAQSNFSSLFNWFVESAFVRTMVNWPATTISEDSQPKLALGSFIGLTILQSIEFIDNSDTKLTLFDFLKKEMNNQSKTVKVITTGHSLGGMLSPPLALWLYEKQSEWDSEGNATIETYPSANPAVGNQDFAQYFESRMGENTHRIWNRLDLANYGWNKLQLLQAPFIYMLSVPPHIRIPPTPLVFAFVALAIHLVKGNNYQHIKPKNLPLPCKFNNYSPEDPNQNQNLEVGECPFKNPVTENKDNDKDFADLKRFLEEVLFQHIEAYYELLGVQELRNLVQSKIEKSQEEFDTEVITLAAKLRQELRTNSDLITLATHLNQAASS